jgi:hypothetical protein
LLGLAAVFFVSVLLCVYPDLLIRINLITITADGDKKKLYNRLVFYTVTHSCETFYLWSHDKNIPTPVWSVRIEKDNSRTASNVSLTSLKMETADAS